MQLNPKNYSHGNKPHFSKGYFPSTNIFGWDFSISDSDGQIHSFVMSFSPRRFQVGLSSVFYGAFEAAVKGCWENTLLLFIPILKKNPKKPQPFMHKSNLQSKEEKSIIISPKLGFVSCKYPEQHSKLTCTKYFPRGCFCVIAVVIVLVFT